MQGWHQHTHAIMLAAASGGSTAARSPVGTAAAAPWAAEVEEPAAGARHRGVPSPHQQLQLCHPDWEPQQHLLIHKCVGQAATTRGVDQRRHFAGRGTRRELVPPAGGRQVAAASGPPGGLCRCQDAAKVRWEPAQRPKGARTTRSVRGSCESEGRSAVDSLKVQCLLGRCWGSQACPFPRLRLACTASRPPVHQEALPA